MDRRAFLSVAATAVLAGCASSSRSSRFEGESCPTIAGTPRTCYHGDGDATGVVLEPESEHLAEPGPLRFTVTNRSGGTVHVPIPGPSLVRRFDGRWKRIPQQRQDSGGSVELPSDESTGLGLIHGGDRPPSSVDYTVPGPNFGAGEYLLAVRTRNSGSSLARFDVDGEERTVEPPSGSVVDRDDGTLTVSPFDEHDATMTLAAEDAEDPIGIAPEVVASRPDLRAAALLARSDVDTVVVRYERGYFRTPIEWLQAANVWEGRERTYSLGDATFGIAEGGAR